MLAIYSIIDFNDTIDLAEQCIILYWSTKTPPIISIAISP